MHRAGFVLPEFGGALLEERKAIIPEKEKKVEGKKRKVLRLGSGYVSWEGAEYILRDPRNELTIGEWLVGLLAIKSDDGKKPAVSLEPLKGWPLPFRAPPPFPSTLLHNLD